MSDQKGNTGSENAFGWFILLCVFFAIFALFWHFNEYNVKDAFRSLRWGEMWLISFFVGDDYTVSFRQYELNFWQWLSNVPDIPAHRLDDVTMGAIGALAMEPLKWLLGVILVLMGMWCMMYGPGTNNRRKMNLDELIRAQSKNFPVIAPFVSFNPSTQPPDRKSVV